MNTEVNSSAKAYKPLFIVGYPRSGTTWTMWLLSQHPDIVASFHGGIFHALEAVIRWQKTHGGFGKFIVANKAGDKTAVLERVEWLEALPPGIFDDALAEMARLFFDVLAAQGQYPAVVVENTPENLLFLEWILDLMPEAHILHVIRDPRSIWLSVRRAMSSWLHPEKEAAFPPTAAKNARLWGEYIQKSREIQRRTAAYNEVRYEALQSDGAAELGRIFGWLGLAADQAFCEQALANSKIEKMKKEIPSPKGFFGSGKAEGWQKSLPKSDIKQIEYLAGDWMDSLGYERQFPSLNGRPWQLSRSIFMSRVALFLRRRLRRW